MIKTKSTVINEIESHIKQGLLEKMEISELTQMVFSAYKHIYSDITFIEIKQLVDKILEEEFTET